MNRFGFRKYFIFGLIIITGFIYLIRLFYIQVIDPAYKYSANNNVLRYITQYPSRGLIFDRNQHLLVCNQAAYDIMVIPNQLSAFDTTELCRILGITQNYVKQKIKEARIYSRYKPSIFLKQVSSATYAVLQEKLYKFPGFFVQTRSLRNYPFNTSAHILGYVGEVDNTITAKDAYYKPGDYIGISGIENTYEKELRGRKGVNIYMVDVHNRIKGSFQNGRFDTICESGKNLTLTIDAKLQMYGEKLMMNKKGSVVAIEPSTGEILAMVSSPSYDPELLVGRERSVNFDMLQRDSLIPLFNRALMAKYPPGSTFKILNALIGLQEGTLYPGTHYGCNMGYYVGRFSLKCHSHPSPLDLPGSIQHSCNAYYCNVFRNFLDQRSKGTTGERYQLWYDYVASFGFGKPLGSDFMNELSGNLPTRKYYDKIYGKDRWVSLNIVSLAIGQGEVLATPLQIANMAAILANRGWYIIPHIAKAIEGKADIDIRYFEKHYPKVKPEYYEPIVKGMEMAVIAGTATIARLPDIVVCGKTGTAENPHGKDHSVFLCFAPKDDPKIAISVYVENSGFGATYAAPVASLMIEKYLTDTIKRPWLEQYILNINLLKSEPKK